MMIWCLFIPRKFNISFSNASDNVGDNFNGKVTKLHTIHNSSRSDLNIRDQNYTNLFHRLGHSYFFRFFSHILERGAKKGTAHDNRSKDTAHLGPSKQLPSPVDERRRVEEFERRLRFAMEQSLYLQAQHLSALDKFEKDLTKAKEESLLSQALLQSRLVAPASEKSRKPLKGILKKARG